jgi:hypothetical protein
MADHLQKDVSLGKGGAAALLRRLAEAGEVPDHRPSWEAAGSESPVRRRRESSKVPQAVTSTLCDRDDALRQSGAGLMLAPIKALHRHSDGFISFAVGGGHGDWNQVVSIRADALDTYFPEFTSQLLRDSLVSINASFCTLAKHKNAPYGRPLHRRDTLRYLNAAYVDLDYYDLGLERWQVVAEVARLESDGVIPPASLTIDSGRGMWLMWMLHDPANELQSHPSARHDDLQLYGKINRALHGRLAHLGADSIPSAASHVRAPGSFRMATGKVVRWDAHGTTAKAFSYSLQWLTDFCGVSVRERGKAERMALADSSAPTGQQRNGWLQTNANRMTVVSTLMDLRAGGFHKGNRNAGAFYYALALKGVRVGKPEARECVKRMAQDCRPPLTEGEIDGAVTQAYQKRPNGSVRSVVLSYATLAGALDITPLEGEAISQAIGGKMFPAAARFGPHVRVTDPKGKEMNRSERRRADIRALLDQQASGGVPSYRAMAKLLLEYSGVQVSHVTIKADYAEMGLPRCRVKRVAPPTLFSHEVLVGGADRTNGEHYLPAIENLTLEGAVGRVRADCAA